MIFREKKKKKNAVFCRSMVIRNATLFLFVEKQVRQNPAAREWHSD